MDIDKDNNRDKEKEKEKEELQEDDTCGEFQGLGWITACRLASS